jgi:hypothetical protein
MSWLSKALGGNTLKVGAVLAGAYFGREYMFGESTGYGYDISTGAMTNPEFTGTNFAADTLNRFGITPFSQTGFGQSAVGQAITSAGNFLGFGTGDDKKQSLFGSALMSQFGKGPQVPNLQLTVGTQNFRGDLGFQPGRVNPFPIGRGGTLEAAVNRAATQQYLARQVAAMRLPAASQLPTPMSATGTSIRTSSAAKRSYSKLTS